MLTLFQLFKIQPEEQTTQGDSHSEAEWSDDPLDCGMRSDSASESEIGDMQRLVY